MNNTERLPNWLKKRAKLSPNRPALEFEGKVLTFRELDSLAEEMAAKLASQNVKRGDSCALLIRNHKDSVVIIHALFYLGVKIVMLNTRLTAAELIWQLRDSEAKLLLSEQYFCEKLNDIQSFMQEISIIEKEDLASIRGIEDVAILEEFDLHETATIMYTSGTTGNPKGVIQTFGNHWWSAIGSVLNLGLTEQDSWYCAVPIFHISGLSIFMRNVIYGMKVVLVEKFNETAANQMIIENGVTIISVVTTMLNRMLINLGSEKYPNSFRCMLLGGGPAPRYMLLECKEKGIPVYQTYGMTETSSQIVTLAPEDSLQKIGSAGKALFPSQLRIEKDGLEVEPNQPGEIVVKGPNVTQGYLNRKEATDEAIKNGWLYTGDIGYVDEDGYLFVMDRRSDLIISGGENVYPAEIEAVVSSHPDVFEAGVTGVSDEVWGQIAVAFVVRKTGSELTEKQIIEYCLTCLASYKVPKRVIFCEELPRNASNKLLRRELRKRLED
ncbi:o-succinylbenzoate--CoA ligase [Bacillus cihuensis]|uniref:o-succinylbenzoate--CoA ligase n=1 Tax=Bacillus cihuensis TaxID=1208599 RepID=UPI0003FF8786|nr:o-succinylbenzoate--CoA ligase [Bacillus cihuensis]